MIMSDSLRFSSSPHNLLNQAFPHGLSRDTSVSFRNISYSSFKTISSLCTNFSPSSSEARRICGKIKVQRVRNEGRPLQEQDDSIELEPIISETQFDGIIEEAQQIGESVILVWMAIWCRKCVYLKPKLEKLAADYYPRLRFYSVEVNKVPQKLVARAGVTKMPTIQLWRDGKRQEEVIGTHKAYLVVDEVRQMIENDDTS